MIDTTTEMMQKQREIFFSKTSNERFIIGAETIAFGRTIVESSIKQKYPEISELELKILVFKRCYENYFSKEEIEIIINSMKNYFLLYNKKSTSPY